MVHKTVLKVDISCEKCKQEHLKVVSGIEGVNKIEADAEKGTLTVLGEADPFAIIMRLRKAGKNAQFVTVGPPPKPEEKKPEEKKPEPCVVPKCPCPGPYWACQPVPVMTMEYRYQDPCCIM